MVGQKTIFLLLSLVLTLVSCLDTYNEELYIKILSDSQVYSQFQFSTSWDAKREDSSDCKLASHGFYFLGQYMC